MNVLTPFSNESERSDAKRFGAIRHSLFCSTIYFTAIAAFAAADARKHSRTRIYRNISLMSYALTISREGGTADNSRAARHVGRLDGSSHLAGSSSTVLPGISLFTTASDTNQGEKTRHSIKTLIVGRPDDRVSLE